MELSDAEKRRLAAKRDGATSGEIAEDEKVSRDTVHGSLRSASAKMDFPPGTPAKEVADDAHKKGLID